MKIPAALTSLYQNDHSLSAFVTTAVGTISSHINSSRMEFFPEYTDHNVTHLESVLSTTTSLMTEEAKALLTPEDAAVLCVATALHDFGMHISKEGFQTLISEANPMVPTGEFSDASWHSLWQDFMGEAARFDGRKLRAIFGENFRPVRHPPPAEQPWEDFDYLLVGEFLRRHHPRLAYDIALTGMPAKAGKFIRICQADTDHQRFLAELAGLVARSHGMELRPCLTYLEKKFHNRVDPRRVRAPYLMVLLRIADFFQIQPQRAPKERTDVVSFKSPLSDLEWKVHQSVTEINNSGSDPEAIVVNANPPDVSSFIRLRSWFSDLQSELDRSWAILGEVYGLQKHNLLCNLNLRIRRVRSNIDNIVDFASAVNYLPIDVSFTSANNDLLNLLIGPLYGGDIGVGIRELIQNAVDAVREFDDLPEAVKNGDDTKRFEISSDVQISIELDDKSQPTFFEITDRGVGMTADVVVNYFLKAGASFRRSDQWKALHEDDKGHSKVIRSGRFGVGALATFLLGEEIEVETRHISLGKN
ncbi:ATP-binding protein [Mesorhizobium sp. M0976]